MLDEKILDVEVSNPWREAIEVEKEDVQAFWR